MHTTWQKVRQNVNTSIKRMPVWKTSSASPGSKTPFFYTVALKTPKTSFLTVSFHDTLGQRDNNIALFALPPHTTQYLNPLDKTVFGPFQRSYNSICTVFVSLSLNHMVTKWEWSRLFREAYITCKSFNKENITTGYEVCEIYPFSIPTTAFARSLPFYRDSENTRPALPSVSALSENVPCFLFS